MAQRLLRLAPLVLIACSLAPSASSAAETDDPSFAAARTAFERGDYATALSLFEAAREHGAEGPSVPFNIGVCEYKLGRFADAEAEFASLGRSFPAMRALADYNRGLALLAAEREDDAREAFAAAGAAGDPKIAALAAERLRDLAPAPEATRSGSPLWRGFLQLAAGHDDNVALVDEVTLPAGQSAGSPLTELLGFGGRSFAGRAHARLDFGGYFVRYSDAPQFDEDSMNVAGTFALARDAWSFDLTPRYERTTLGGNVFESETGIALRVDRPLDRGWRFGAFAAYDDVGSLSSQYDYLAGARRQMRVSVAQSGARGRFTAALEAEDNDRAAPSVSSTRQRISLGYRRGLGADWSVEGAIAYRLSRYDRPSGDERLTEVLASVRRTLGRDWSLMLDYRHSDNDADLSDFTYTADRFALGISRTF
jgi:tetratricopeptide (TPR) repeat protein